MKNDIALSSSGWQGAVDDGLTEENILQWAQAFIRYLFQSRGMQATVRVAIGYDGRKNSRGYASLVAEALSENGVDVLLSSGVVPTPVVSFATKHNNCTSGIMITGGHYPPEYNGIEFKGAYGGPLLPEELAKVESLLSNSTKESVGPSKASRKEITQFDFLPDYLSHLETVIDFSALRSFAKNPKNTANVLIDSMGGAAQTIIEDLLVRCGWRAQTLFGTPEDQFFDRSPEPASENLDALKYNVKVIDAQFGIATDASGGRCGIVYNDGEWMNLQETILALLYHLYVQRRDRGNIFKPAFVTDRVKRLSDNWNIPLLDTGLENGIENMFKNDCLLGIVGRGGYCYGKDLPDCDGILSGLYFAEMIAKAEKPLKEIIQHICDIAGKAYYGSIDIASDISAANLVHNLRVSLPKHFNDMGECSVDTYKWREEVKGIKYRWDENRWLLIEPLAFKSMIRLHSEAESEEDLLTLLANGKKWLAH
ncbi:MAG: hypothetical protein WBZ48_06865 [Bacteroidota bacterium]